ncbi:hypothetical protein [Thermococcus sp.]|uniref:hypothetical protein n=1 Tax=Thermococcus sp. TaxID=35749 RepID=UPI00260A82A8|nr:hypothetical protein [Thermococcus sp.]
MSLNKSGGREMKRLALIILLLLFMSVVAGCIGERSSTSTSPELTLKPKQPSREELLEGLKEIKQFTFIDNTSLKLNMTLVQGNLTQSQKVTLIYNRKGYLDFTERKAEINITTVVFPGGASTLTREVIVGNDVYVSVGGNWFKLTNESIGLPPSIVLNMTWKYNIVNFTMKYLSKEPYRVEFRNGTQFLYYNLTYEDLKAIFEGLLGRASNMTTNLTGGVLELRFRGTSLIGGRAGYRVSTHIWGERLGQRFDVYEKGFVYDEFIITDVNVKKKVEAPSAFHA